MTFTADQLYRLLPAGHRELDAEQGFPLRELIEVIAAQVAVTEESLEQLYENSFVETAAPWALPYLGDLLGIRGLSGDKALTRAPRAEVGHTIAYRRRKGTAAVLEQLAHDVTSWPAHVVEYFTRLALTQHVNHVRPENQAFAALRDADALEFFDSPFETATRTVDVRRITSGRGKWNIPNIGLFLWRLGAYSATDVPLTPAALADGRHFLLNPLGLDQQVFTRPETEDEIEHLAEPTNVPIPITRRMLEGAPYQAAANQFHPSASYYGAGRSIVLSTADPVSDIAATAVLVADLANVVDGGGNVIAWGHEAFGESENKILLDPMRGRVLLPAARADRLFASYHYGFSMNIGGGEYDRSRSFIAEEGAVVRVAEPDPAAVSSITSGVQALGTHSGAVQIDDSGRYDETLTAVTAVKRHVEIRAAESRRPSVRLANTLELTGDADGAITLNGLLITGKPITVTGDLGRLRLRHCTILPHLVVGNDGHAVLSAQPALVIKSLNTVVEIDACIIGGIRVDAAKDVTVHVADSVVDASGPEDIALSDLVGKGPAGRWKIERSTIIGKAHLSVLDLASNSIFLGATTADDDPTVWPAALLVQRRQEGCVRFSWLPAGARTPRRHNCLSPEGSRGVRPSFTSLRYGDAAYAQLGRFCPPSILRGADDESEIGAFHDLHQSQRIEYLRARLAEYLRFGLEAGLFTAS